jgi:hypothetical protein
MAAQAQDNDHRGGGYRQNGDDRGEHHDGDHHDGGRREGGRHEGGQPGWDQRGGDHRGQYGDQRGGGYGDHRGQYGGRFDHNDRGYGRADEWRGERDRHPGDYGRGNWRAPFAYRSFGIGATLPRDYWAPRYYMNDWARYRLPRPAYGFYRYVRHYDDVLLVDVRSGRVIRVYRSFYR